jgi:hypothetical protein
MKNSHHSGIDTRSVTLLVSLLVSVKDIPLLALLSDVIIHKWNLGRKMYCELGDVIGGIRSLAICPDYVVAALEGTFAINS